MHPADRWREVGRRSAELGQAIEEFPNVTRWRAAIRDRPAVKRGVDLGKELRRSAPPTDEERKILFSQTARHLRG